LDGHACDSPNQARGVISDAFPGHKIHLNALVVT
jgi:hypothetical protein